MAPKRPYMCSISRSFRPFSNNSRQFQKISEDYARLPNTVDVRRLPQPLLAFITDFPGAAVNAEILGAFHEKSSKHLTLFFPGTINNHKNNNNKTLKIIGKYHLTLVTAALRSQRYVVKA